MAKSVWCTDFSIASVSDDDRGTFIHECVHVWQFYHGITKLSAVKLFFWYRSDYFPKAYRYDLWDNDDLTDYNMEQQASIVAEYFQRKAYGADVALHEKVLQKFLNNPSYAHRDNFPGIFSFASKF